VKLSAAAVRSGVEDGIIASFFSPKFPTLRLVGFGCADFRSEMTPASRFPAEEDSSAAAACRGNLEGWIGGHTFALSPPSLVGELHPGRSGFYLWWRGSSAGRGRIEAVTRSDAPIHDFAASLLGARRLPRPETCTIAGVR